MTFAHVGLTDGALVVALCGASVLLYRWGTEPPPGRGRSARSTRRLWCWYVAMASILAVQLPPVGTYVDDSFAVHMVQHVVFLFVTAPLMVLARPGAAAGTLARRWGVTDDRLRPLRAAVRAVSTPVVCWAVVVGFVWVVHFSPLYDLAVRDDVVHALEHLGFIGAGVLAWLPVLGPRRSALPDPLAVLYVLVLMPALTFCGLALFSADHVLYPSYAGQADPLADQRLGGMLMWVLPVVALLPLLLGLVVRWWRREERAAEMSDRLGGERALDATRPTWLAEPRPPTQ